MEIARLCHPSAFASEEGTLHDSGWQLRKKTDPRYDVSNDEVNKALALKLEVLELSDEDLVFRLQIARLVEKYGDSLLTKLSRNRFDHSKKTMYAGPNEHASFLKAEYWTTYEAAALLCGLNPTTIQYDNVRSSLPELAWTDFDGLVMLVERAITTMKIAPEMTPGAYIAWAREKEIQLPVMFEFEIVDKLPSENPLAVDNALKNKSPLHTRERDSLLRLVIGMAVEQYGYCAKDHRSQTITHIVSDLESAGVPLSDDTVRKYLNEAKELLPPATD